MKDRPLETNPSLVPQGATQGGEARARWPHAEPAVWTERMLTALETGVKGGKWFSLMDKVYAPRTLEAAFGRVKANNGAPGMDHQTVAMFEQRQEANLVQLSEDLRTGGYAPRPVQRVWIPKPGRKNEKRPLGIPTVRDRVAQTALRYALEPIFERDFAEHSYGFRPGRGCKDALRRVAALLKEGDTWIVDADVRSYFDNIPREPLLTRVREKIADGRVLELIEAYLKQPILEGLKQWTPEGGTPQGAIISPLLANIYLNPLDHAMEQAGYKMTRYADDFIVQCETQAEAREALRLITAWIEANGLRLHPEKTRIVDATQKGGFDFLGYHFERGMRWPSRKSESKFRRAITRKTHRNNGHSMAAIVDEVNLTVRGWFEYFKHSKPNTFSNLDGWVRMRLRSILRKRRRGKGRGRGADHQRWPNAYFANLGLISMLSAYSEARQSV